MRAGVGACSLLEVEAELVGYGLMGSGFYFLILSIDY